MKLSFLINRLLRMSPAEIGYRIGQTLQAAVERLLVSVLTKRVRIKGLLATEPGNRLDPAQLAAQLATGLDSGVRQLLLAKANGIVQHKLDLFALQGCELGYAVDFHKDYSSGKKAPAHLFGKKINYRDYEQIGDIKYIWEINRLQFLLPLALAYKLTDEKRYLDSFVDYLAAWFKQNPFLYGVNWLSTLELGLRLITWSLCWLLLADDLPADFKITWLDSVYRHCWFVNRNFSAHSSANNHLLGESTGLFTACLVFPAFAPGRQHKWLVRAHRLLVREFHRQNYSDGVNKEQAIWYEHQVLDYALLAVLAGQRHGHPFPPGIRHQLEQGLVHLAAMLDYGGHMPAIGDHDGGLVLDFGQSSRNQDNAYHSLLNTGACLFERPDFLSPHLPLALDLKTICLQMLGGYKVKNSTLKNQVPLQPDTWPLSFRHGGYYILGTDFNTTREEKLIFDCGPLGYLAIAAHGHADALSFVFSAHGEPVFIDSGTYSYHTHPLWRTYFRRTLAHNTLCVEGQDQSTMTGPFMWSAHAGTGSIAYTPAKHIKGSHTGYQRLPQKVTHVREINFNEESREWEIIDRVQGKGRYKIQILFHCAPGCRVTHTSPHCQIDFKAGVCLLEPPADLTVSLHKGEKTPPLGWYAPSYLKRLPATTILLEGWVKEEAVFINRFKITR